MVAMRVAQGWAGMLPGRVVCRQVPILALVGWAPQHSHRTLRGTMGGPELFSLRSVGLGLLLRLALTLPPSRIPSRWAGSLLKGRAVSCSLLPHTPPTPAPYHSLNQSRP